MAKSDYKFFFPFRVRYSEIDAQGIVSKVKMSYCFKRSCSQKNRRRYNHIALAGFLRNALGRLHHLIS